MLTVTPLDVKISSVVTFYFVFSKQSRSPTATATSSSVLYISIIFHIESQFITD